MNRLLKFVLLTNRKKKLLFQSFFLLWLVRIGLWIFSYKKLKIWLSYFNSKLDDERPINWENVYEVVRSVKVCSRYVPYASCLTQALATQKLLSSGGQRSELKIGVCKEEDGNFLAHAWVEINGKIIIGKKQFHRRFVVLRSPDQVAV